MAAVTETRPGLPIRDHMEGCPAPPDRVEVYRTERPDGTPVVVTRCGECGGATYEKNPIRNGD